MSDYPEIDILDLDRKQIWPKGKRLKPDVLDARQPLLDKSTPISSMGSCFASEIRTWLINHEYNYMAVGSEAQRQGTACLWGVVYNTFTMRQEFERILENTFQPTEEVWHDADGMLMCPYRKIPPWHDWAQAEHLSEYQTDVIHYRTDARGILKNVDVFVLTLGLTEIWGEQLWRRILSSTSCPCV